MGNEPTLQKWPLPPSKAKMKSKIPSLRKREPEQVSLYVTGREDLESVEPQSDQSQGMGDTSHLQFHCYEEQPYRYV